MDEQALKELGRRISNWGRWGDDDEIGTLNFVTPERRVAAAQLVRTGKLFELAMPLSADGPQPGGLRFNPIHRMSVTPADWADYPGGVVAADDMIIMPLQCATQWDALSHVGYDGLLYNGHKASEVTGAGAAKNSIDKTVERFITRGVLLDIARLKGVDQLPVSYRITPEDLEAAEQRQGVRVGSGDVLCVRTGWYREFLAGNHEAYLGDQPGLAIACAEWLHDREVAAIATDNYAVEAMPSEIDGLIIPLHMILIRDVGLTLGEMFNLEQLSADCEDDGVWEFMFCGAPLKIPGAVGSPLTPIAVK